MFTEERDKESFWRYWSSVFLDLKVCQLGVRIFRVVLGMFWAGGWIRILTFLEDGSRLISRILILIHFSGEVVVGEGRSSLYSFSGMSERRGWGESTKSVGGAGGEGVVVVSSDSRALSRIRMFGTE